MSGSRPKLPVRPRRDPVGPWGHYVNDLLVRRGLSYRGAYERINEAAHAGGDRWVSYGRHTIRNWIGGVIPHADALRWIAEGWNEPIESVSAQAEAHRVWRYEQQALAASRAASSLGSAAATGRGCPTPAQPGTVVAADVTVPADRAPFWSEVRIATSRRHVGEAQVRQVERAVGRLYARDLQFGAGDLSVRGLGLLRWACGLLESGAYRPEVEQPLRSAVGNLSICLGWLVFDAGRHADASHLYTEALAIARLARDPLLEMHAFSSMSHQATALGQTRRAVACARAAQEVGNGRMTPRVQSLLALREARASAAAGDRSAFEDCRRRAAAAFQRGPRADDPHWIGFLDEADLAGHLGRCYADLQDEAEADRLLRTPFGGIWDPSQQRNRAAWSLLLARVLLRQRKLDEACDVGSQVLDVVVGLDSRRIFQQVREFSLRLETSGDVPIVRDLVERIHAILQDPIGGK